MKKIVSISLCILMLLGMVGCGGEPEYTYDPTENFSEIEWPDSALAKRLPSPELAYGEIKYEQEDSFCIYFGNVSREKYDSYVKQCKDAGFTVDYNKSNTVYWAYDAEGYYMYVAYDEEYTMMRFETRKPKEKEESTTTLKGFSTTTTTKSESIGSDFKKAMDAYETFMNKYVDFMKKYRANPTDLSLLADYATYMSDYAKFCSEFAEWEDENLNAAELAYYVDVQARVTKKLLEVAG